jgi:hypothetical protein
MNSYYGHWVCRASDKNKRLGRIEAEVAKGLVRVRWRGGELEDRIPLKDLVFVKRLIPTDEDAS